MQNSNSSLLGAVAFTEGMMVLAAAIFLAAAAGPIASAPPTPTPPRRAGLFFNGRWPISRTLARRCRWWPCPGWRRFWAASPSSGGWGKDLTFGSEVTETLTILRRHRAIAFGLAARLLAAAILVGVLAHVLSE